MPDEEKELDTQGPLSDDVIDELAAEDGALEDDADEIDRGFLTDEDETEEI